MDLARLLPMLLMALLAAAAPASASTVRLDPGGGDSSSEVTYTAAAGEQNKVSVAIDRGKATIDDPGASSITTQQGCTQQTPKRAVCDLQDSTETIQYVVADLGDGNDTFELRQAFLRSAKTRFRTRYGARDFRFKTQSARITVPLNAAGRKQLRKPVIRLQLTLRLKETATGKVHQFEWTETMNRTFLKDRGVG